MLAAGSAAWAGDGHSSQPVVRACLNPGGNAVVFNPGRAIAAQLLARAGVRLEWKNDERSCAESGIVVTVLLGTPLEVHPGAFAFAMPYEGVRIVVFYDRVRDATSARALPGLVGHVLAHEIAHILQGVERHSAGGLMNWRWNARDYADMQRGGLRFTAEDILLIQNGIARSMIVKQQ